MPSAEYATERARLAEAARAAEALRADHKETAGASCHTLVNSQGLKLFVRTWEPTTTGATRAAPAPAPAPATGLVVLVHGVTVHSGVFDGVAQHLAAQGLAVVCYDQQGHGRSDSWQGLRGCVRAFGDWMDDCELVVDWARQAYPAAAARTFLLGESLGGTVVASGLRRSGLRGKVRGVVLMAPALRLAPHNLPPKAVMPLLKLAARLFPRAETPDDSTTDPAKWRAAFGDDAYAAALYADPLVHTRPMRLHMLLLVGAFEQLWAHLEELDTPLMVAHAPGDGRTELAASRALVARSPAADKELLVVEGGRHVLFHDQPAISAKVLQRVTQWLTARCT
ncbi:hypothetical protein HXX76_009921 [Chlamydomonas incerta]|uniref:Serine aminopeptidase S33 domain-containing protein n=1 Tax=Chlamydomonas incerta TaxID=51695 RepID=A0A835SW29_CHLIN|nr:hypothetical protein HXX76_009921 [Chlamydomonas incerta]|eukprot:KAG2430953.1 hypothetical protein HXX76_009921 [Chlamydomonas incerta]